MILMFQVLEIVLSFRPSPKHLLCRVLQCFIFRVEPGIDTIFVLFFYSILLFIIRGGSFY